MQTVVIVIHLMVVLIMTGLVLLQRSEGGGLGMGGGGGFLTNRGTSNILSRSTAILAGIFFATSLLLSILAGLDRKPRSILNSGGPASSDPAAPLSAPASIPLGSGRGAAPPSSAPATPAPPAAPQSQ